MICRQPLGSITETLESYWDAVTGTYRAIKEPIQEGIDSATAAYNWVQDKIGGGSRSTAAINPQRAWIHLATAQTAYLNTPYGRYAFDPRQVSLEGMRAYERRANQLIAAIRAGVPAGSVVRVSIIGPNRVRVSVGTGPAGFFRDVSADFIASYDPSRPVAAGWPTEMATLVRRYQERVHAVVAAHFSPQTRTSFATPTLTADDFGPLGPNVGVPGSDPSVVASTRITKPSGFSWGKAALVAGSAALAWRLL